MLRPKYEYLLRWNDHLGRWTARAVRRVEDRLTWVSPGFSSVGEPPWVARPPGWEEGGPLADDGLDYGRASRAVGGGAGECR